MFVYAENGTLVNLDNAKHITIKPYNNNTYAVVVDDKDVLCREDTAEDAQQIVAEIAYGIKHCDRVFFIGEVPMPF
jgi:hypothetical protein